MQTIEVKEGWAPVPHYLFKVPGVQTKGENEGIKPHFRGMTLN